MRFDSTAASIAIGFATLAGSAGCGGESDVLPVGGPQGGTLNEKVLGEGGIVGDGDGVQEASYASGQAMAIDGVPTWTELYKAYFGPGTIGDCANGPNNCHISPPEMTTPAIAYKYLEMEDQVGGSTPTMPMLLDPVQSSLLWVNPSGLAPMPPDSLAPPSEPKAVQAFEAWAKAGGQNN